jgi:hypothetical protein
LLILVWGNGFCFLLGEVFLKPMASSFWREWGKALGGGESASLCAVWAVEHGGTQSR